MAAEHPDRTISDSPLRVGILGFGAIGSTFLDALGRESGSVKATVVLTTTAGAAKAARQVGDDVTVVTSWEHFIAAGPDIMVECAGHAALRQYGARALHSGLDLIVASVGALADRALEDELRAATGSGGRLVVPGGAVAGLDALGAARRAGLDHVAYTARKAPEAWRGTQAERLIDLGRVSKPTVFFEGDARAAALAFPQNANVVAAVSLSGLGFDRTEVRLAADPATPGNCHLIEASGAFGEISSSVLAKTFPQNPKTSMLAPFSLVRAVVNLADRVIV